MFQSTPLPTGRSDADEWRSTWCWLCFNPRPSQPEGATTELTIPHLHSSVSIHAPPNRKERPSASCVCSVGTGVSIHAPPNRKERLQRRGKHEHKDNVSIHAPPNRKERLWAWVTWRSLAMFQSTPLPTGRSDIGGTSTPCAQKGFNPRPSQPEGATRWLWRCVCQAKVSIHAPPNRKERLAFCHGANNAKKFQSTPLPTGRSDRAAVLRYASQRCFNPRPSQPEGATRRHAAHDRLCSVSIHAPPNRKERPLALGTGKLHA